MAKSEHPEQITYYIDGILYDNLMLARKKNLDDWDFVYIIDGRERGGKSVFGQLLAVTLDPTFNLDRMVFTPKQFEEAVKKSEHNKAIIYDEGFGGLNSRSAMSKTNKTLVKMMTEIGFKNLFIIVILPSFFDLDRYMAIHRSVALFHVYTGKDLERGYFRAYNYETKKIIYLMGKKGYNYKPATSTGGSINPNFYGRFTNQWFVDKDAYLRKKSRSALEVAEEKADDDYEEAKKRILDADFLTNEQKAKLLDRGIATIYREKAKLLADDDAEDGLSE